MNPNDCLEIYNTYPRKVCRRAALLEIERALRRLVDGESGEKMEYEKAVFELLKATSVFARSQAGNKGPFTPHPTSWFHQSRYLDDPKEWGVVPERKDEEMTEEERAYALSWNRKERERIAAKTR